MSGHDEALMAKAAEAMIQHQRIPLFNAPGGKRCGGCDYMYGEPDGPNSPSHVEHQARAVLDAVADDLRAEALREAASEMNAEGISFKPAGWGSNPADQQTLDALVAAMNWLRDRADRIEARDV